MSLRHNTLWNLAGTGLPFVLGAVTIPYLIKQIGVEAFGILTLVWALIGYFSLFDFGLGRALTQQVAAARSAGLEQLLPSLVKTGLLFTAATGLLGGLVLAGLSHQLAQNWLGISPLLQESATSALLIAALGIPLTTLTTGLRGVLEAYEDFRIVNLLRIVLGAANFGLPALSVMYFGNSLGWMVLSLVLARIIILAVHGWKVHQRMSSGWIKERATKENMRRLLSFGAWMTVSNIISPLMVTADRFVISGVLGASLVAYYTVPFEALIRILIIPAALTSALFPKISKLIIYNNFEARRLYKKCLLAVFFVLFPLCLFVAFSAKWGLMLWLGQDFADHSWAIVAVMALGIMLNGLAQVPFSAIHASGDARTTAYLHMVELVIYFPILLISLKMFGLMGAALAWTIRVAIDLIVLLIYANKKLYSFN